MSLVIALFAMSAMANRIMWVGIGDNPQVEVNGVMTPLGTWIASLPCNPADVAARIRINDEVMPAGYEDPPGQNPPAVSFDDEITDFGVLMVEESSQDTWTPVVPWTYSDRQPIRLDNTDLNATVFFDLGYVDADGNFTQVASTSAVLGDLWDSHTYEAGTLLPPTETPWRPFAAVPEPSTTILALFGVGMLLKRRK